MAIITLSTPQDVSLGSFTAWIDINVSGITGYTASVTGVVVEVVDTGSSNLAYGLRKNGSTDNRVGNIVGETNGTHLMATVGVDGSGIFEGYAGSSELDFYVVAFITEDTFFTNAVDVSIGTTSAWTDKDVSADTGGDTATYIWVESLIVGASAMGVRKNGSTDDRRALSWRHNFGGVALDGSEIFEQYIANTTSDFYMLGYGNSATMTWHTNGIDRSTGTTGSYQTITTPGATAIAAFYDVYTGTDVAERYAIRSVGDTVEHFQRLYPRAYWTVALDSTNQTAEQKIGATTVDLYEQAWWAAAAAPTPAIVLPRTSPGTFARLRR
jgi:hypothetical protein